MTLLSVTIIASHCFNIANMYIQDPFGPKDAKRHQPAWKTSILHHAFTVALARVCSARHKASECCCTAHILA